MGKNKSGFTQSLGKNKGLRLLQDRRNDLNALSVRNVSPVNVISSVTALTAMKSYI